MKITCNKVLHSLATYPQQERPLLFRSVQSELQGFQSPADVQKEPACYYFPLWHARLRSFTFKSVCIILYVLLSCFARLQEIQYCIHRYVAWPTKVSRALLSRAHHGRLLSGWVGARREAIFLSPLQTRQGTMRVLVLVPIL